MDIRKQAIENSRTILYQDDTFFIAESAEDSRDYNILIQDTYVFFQRGILEQAARSEKGKLVSILENVKPEVLVAIMEKRISLESFGWALAKAYIQLEENYRDHIVDSSEGAEDE